MPDSIPRRTTTPCAASVQLSGGARLDVTFWLLPDSQRDLGITTRGVKQAPFRVLIGVNAPAVLVEVAFISNAEEEQKIASEEFRTAVAETLAGSLDTFFRAAADAVAPVPFVPPSNGRR